MRLLTRQFSIGNMNKSGKSGLIALVLIAACAHAMLMERVPKSEMDCY